jgi:hypothetical protein
LLTDARIGHNVFGKGFVVRLRIAAPAADDQAEARTHGERKKDY